MDSDESSVAALSLNTDLSVQRDLELPNPNSPEDTNDGASTESLESIDNFSNKDIALGDGIRSYASSLTSVRPSVYQYVEEGGRKYHAYKAGKYLLPNDELEQDRLDYQHAIFRELLDQKLALAPIDSIPIHNVLDIATGTGLWATEFADAHPSARVIGTDLSPIQPTMVPVNCSFEIDDADDEWIFSHKFDYIHARMVMTCFKDARKVMHSAAAFLSPGGYLEYQDGMLPMKFHEPPPPESAFVKWINLVMEASEKIGRHSGNAQHYTEWMREAGLVDIEERKFFLAVGPWPENKRDKRLGAYNRANWIEAIEGPTMKLLGLVGWGENECKVLVAQAKKNLMEGTVKPYMDVLVCWAKKPAEEAETQ